MRLVGSLVVHAVLGAALFALVSRPPRDVASPPATATAIEMVEVTRPPAPTPPPVLVASADRAGGGGSSSPKRSSRTPRRVAAFEDPRGAITFEVGSEGAGDGTETGTGVGAGRGIGFGDGVAIAQPGETPVPPPPPPPPPVSKARPPRLIFPSRQRDVEDGQLFVMRVTVDRDGYVAGARLVRGFGGRRDEVAQDQIWRFRYDPALDDEGRPIAATIEQRFLVQ